MHKIFDFIGGIGFVAMLIGVGGMDSESIVIPAIMAAIGLIMVVVAAWGCRDVKHS